MFNSVALTTARNRSGPASDTRPPCVNGGVPISVTPRKTKGRPAAGRPFSGLAGACGWLTAVLLRTSWDAVRRETLPALADLPHSGDRYVSRPMILVVAATEAELAGAAGAET